MRRARRDLRRTVLATPLALLALATTASAGTAPASVVVGGVPSLSAGATSLGRLGSAAPLRLTVVLAPRDPAGLAALATAVSTPGSAQYHRYLSVGQFAARFGASPDAVAAVRATLLGDGLSPGALAPDGLSIAVSGSAAQASQAFTVSLRRYRERDGRQVFSNTAAPRVPAALGGVVQDVLGLDNVPAAAPASLRRGRLKAVAHAASQPFTGGSGPVPCTAASLGTGPTGPYTIDQVANAYGIGGLYSGGDLGAGVTIALYELEPYAAGDLGAFRTCFSASAAVTNVAVDGGPVPDTPPDPASGLETSLDLDNVIGVAPSSHVHVYQGPNTNGGVYDTFAAIVGDDTAQVVSDSWGLCEPLTDPTELAAENTLFQEAATQGQSVFVAAGDSGSAACAPANGSPALAVDDAASQPFVTGVGGTRLGALGPPTVESVWNGSGGGGISAFWTMPSYQTAAVPGVINSFSSGVPCSAQVPLGYCREVPDVSADAAPSTGYRVYWNGGWLDVGGTSAAAPLWAGLTALADASGIGVCAPGSPLGLLNPALYAIAAGVGHADALNDIISGNNNPSGFGAYPATTGYDMATGLGTPIATDGALPGLVTQLCAPAPTVTSVSPAEAAPGTTVTVQGTGLASTATVSFGAKAATNVALISDSQLNATVPAGTASVDVTVSTAKGTSATATADRFTYAPTETISAPATGATYTQSQTVLAAYSCAASAPGTPTCTGPVPTTSPIDTSTTGQHSFTVTATDSNAVSTQQTVSYSVVAPPAATITTPANGAAYTQGQTLGAAYGCAASTSGAPSCTGTVSNGATIDTSSTGARSFSVTATDANGVSATQTASYTIVSRPQVTINVPAAGATYPLGSTATASFVCAAASPLVIAACAGPVAAGAKIDTSSVGSHSFTVTATDSNGVAAKRTVSYTVTARRPTISGLRQARSAWLERRVAATRLAVGTRFSFSLDQAAVVTLEFMRTGSGRMAGGRCVAPSAANRSARRCSRRVIAGALTLRAGAGAATLAFSGATASGTLAPGAYTVLVSAVATGGQRSAVHSLRFVVARATGS
jgi:subtilase family serine protease